MGSSSVMERPGGGGGDGAHGVQRVVPGFVVALVSYKEARLPKVMWSWPAPSWGSWPVSPALACTSLMPLTRPSTPASVEHFSEETPPPDPAGATPSANVRHAVPHRLTPPLSKLFWLQRTS